MLRLCAAVYTTPKLFNPENTETLYRPCFSLKTLELRFCVVGSTRGHFSNARKNQESLAFKLWSQSSVDRSVWWRMKSNKLNNMDYLFYLHENFLAFLHHHVHFVLPSNQLSSTTIYNYVFWVV